MSDTILKVEGLSKKFCRNLRRALWHGMKDLAAELGSVRTHRDRLRTDEFWALRDISFELHPGETLGLIGHNGAGKSTLLKLINGLIKPDLGNIRVRRRIGALIELGAGFHPILTGRENIYVNAAILGLGRAEVDRNLDYIIDFAELGDFIEAPLQSYSSGMRVRLGYAIAANLNPDLLLIDEVLSVGDSSFRARCIDHLAGYKEQGGTAIFVSHNTAAVEAISDRVMYLDHGRVVEIGPPAEVIRRYEEKSLVLSRLSAARLQKDVPSTDESAIRILSVTCHKAGGELESEFEFGESIEVHIRYEAGQLPDSPYFILGIQKSGQGVANVAVASTLWDGIDLQSLPDRGELQCLLAAPPLSPGNYRITLGVQANVSMQLGQKWYLHPEPMAGFSVKVGSLRERFPGAPADHLTSRMPPLVLNHSWRLDGRPLGAAEESD